MSAAEARVPDASGPGVDFVGILFALVIAEVLQPLRHPQAIATVGYTHLALVGVLTTTSWIGYHYCPTRLRTAITFDLANAALWSFAIDIAMVVTYWLAATQAEVSSAWYVAVASARPEAWLVCLSFGLYVIWDRLSEAGNHHWTMVLKRERATIAGLVVTGAIAIGVELAEPTSGVAIALVDLILIVVVIAYRFAAQHYLETA